jgi:DNA polymerase
MISCEQLCSQEACAIAADRNILDQLLALRSRIVACRDCTTLAPWRKFPVDYLGNIDTGYMLVGEAPGYISWRNSRAFSNPRNYVLREALADLNHPRYKTLEDLFYVTDVVRCHPAAGESLANRSPTPTEVRLCSRHLRDEIELLRPRVHVAIGRLAVEFLMGQPVKITQEHAKRHVGPYNSEVIILMHPSGRNKQHLLNMGLTPEGYRRQVAAIFADLIERLEHPRLHRF